MEVIFLGTTSAIPSKSRNHTAIVLKAFGEVILFDCGEGTQRQMTIAKISPMKIDKIFISHLHGDHILGLAGIIQSMGFRGRDEPLNIYGPVGIKKMVENIFNIGYFVINFNIYVFEYKGDRIEKIIDNKDYTISCIKTKHAISNLSYSLVEKKKPRFLKDEAIKLGVVPGPDFKKLHNGLEVEVNGNIIKPEQVLGPERTGIKLVYSGDSRPCDEMVELAEDADLLIHESTFDESDRERAIETSHSTSKEAATIAKNANVKELVLTHISPRYLNTKNIEESAKKVFKNTKIAYDFMKIELKKTD